MNLEMRLVTSDQAEAAAAVLKKGFSQYEEMNASSFDELFLPSVVDIARSEFVISAVDTDTEQIVGVYQLPKPVMESNRVAISDGHIATKPERVGIGSYMMDRLVLILSQVSSTLGREVVHRPILRRENPMYERQGYRVAKRTRGLRFDPVSYERTYRSFSSSELSPPELEFHDRLVAAVLDR